MKTRKLITSSVVLSAILVSVSIPTGLAFAATTASTKADVELTAGTGSGGAGPLNLDKAPAFNFGSQEIATTLKTYNADGDVPLTVSDIRGTGEGWTVNAKITTFASTDRTLTGAEFILPAVVPTSPEGNSPKPDDTKATTLNATDQQVFGAKKDTGLGQWKAKYDKAELKIPSGNYAGKYSATIEWTLLAQPAV
ncbi:WxL domain-containing protein [Carnobacterium gallinarum]|uniref:WxL domain-containing protein n=1 Tax=Carnobacterium gallinarum TaxID=2749 RepID=UPI000690E91C|nr:WxL domain-containing protein [Carnobacterium gallinarum]